MGFNINFVTWVMHCVSSFSFAMLINGSASDLFYLSSRLRQEFSLSPLLFLLVVEDLRRSLFKDKLSLELLKGSK